MTEGMKCGYGHGMQPGGAPAPADFLAFAEKVERAGFDSFWLDDHLAFRGASPWAAWSISCPCGGRPSPPRPRPPWTT